MTVFRGWSYDEIILPMFDYQDLFTRGMGRDKADRTYRFVDRDGSLLALRPELTSLVARTVATRFRRKPRPVRLCYSGEVFRYDEPTQRTAREFHQVGLEQIGEPGIAADLEILLIAVETLTSLRLDGFRIALSHVDFFNGLASQLGLDEPERGKLRELIDRRNSQALDQFLVSQAPRMGASERTQFCQLIGPAEGDASLMLARQVLANEPSLKAVSHLMLVHETLEQLGLAAHFAIDLGEAADLDYYTGLTFRIYVPDLGTAIGSGGRYDKLIGNFGETEAAIGFSLSLDGLAGALASQHPDAPWRADEESETIDPVDQLSRLLGRARELRAQNRKVRIGSDQS